MLKNGLWMLVVWPVLLGANEVEYEALQQELKELEQTISTQQQRLQLSKQRQKQSEQQLKNSEQALSHLEKKIDSQTISLARAKQASTTQAERVGRLQHILETQLQYDFMQRRKPGRGWVNVQQSGEQRRLALMRHIHAAQKNITASAQLGLVELDQQQKNIEYALHQLSKTTSAQRALVKATAKTQRQQQQQAEALSQVLSDQTQRRQHLAKQAEALAKVIADLEASKQSANWGDSLLKQKGQLPWPVQGKLIHRYGQQRSGTQLQWQGWMFDVQSGAEVLAVAAGRVAYADWIVGLGLLVIVEHDAQHLSLYAHNQTLRVKEGQWVKQGDSIALAGRSGGQQAPQLYFEIRQNATPQDPKQWLRQASP